MLAHKLDESRIDWSKNVYMQPKLDGVRCLFTKDGAFSRTGKQFMNVKHIEEELQDWFKACPWIALDGELYNHDLKDDFEKIISLVRKQKPTDEDRSEARRLTQYHVYDYTGRDYMSLEGLSYKDRLDNLTCSDMYTPSVHYVKTKRVRNMKAAKYFHKIMLDKGYEGSILRTDTPYKHGRSYGLMKFKDFNDAEAEIIGWVEGKGKRRGTIGKFIAADSDGNRFGMPVMDKFKYLQENFEEMQGWKGKIATFTYFERTKANSYRHPLFKALRNYE